MGAGGDPTLIESKTSALPTSTKTVFLIRHAESEENRRLSSLRRCFGNLGKFSLPSRKDVSSSMQLLNVYAQVDSDVSQVGEEQIAQLGKQMKEDDFLTTEGVQLVAHSPLKRARQTSQGMLGCAADSSGVLAKAEGVNRVEELQLLIEKTPEEWVPGNYKSFADRMEAFQTWLGEQPENVIAVVGHSQYFKAMLGLDFKFGNCDVWEVKYATEQDGTTKETAETSKDENAKSSYVLPHGWSDLKRLYTLNDNISESKDAS